MGDALQASAERVADEDEPVGLDHPVEIARAGVEVRNMMDDHRQEREVERLVGRRMATAPPSWYATRGCALPRSASARIFADGSKATTRASNASARSTEKRPVPAPRSRMVRSLRPRPT